MKQLHGTDQRTMAYINLYGVLGSLEQLCQVDSQAKALIADKQISLGFRVTNGPRATLIFEGGTCRLENGDENCDIRLPFASPEKFNGMIEGTVTPIPSKGLTKIKFLTHTFVPLTNILTKYLRAEPRDLLDSDFFEKSTTLMFYTIAVAIAQIGCHDRIGRASAGYLCDGAVALHIAGGPTAAICCKDHRLLTLKQRHASPMATMEFGSMEIARGLFEGKRNALTCVGMGDIRLSGMLSMIDNVNRILDRVALYLA